ncbi:M43 family zinc metalloprotease [Pontibacter sp. G13]|uniref:M43 family zinc metalloprotease n=1 Tax=Pontibacter sp. G13 TaxID=3074898 RepID=UPI00288905CC|nr:M43 family zinc metalloprotease [Pontibacter sp. G13]WNJ16327.1 M43 family zinc metalloprotease [Pontibacter sp. G13]
MPRIALSFWLCWIVLLCSSHLVAQQTHDHEKCGTVHAWEMDNAQHPNMESREDFERWLQQQMAAGRSSDTLITIPVIVHVIHQGENVGAGTNLSQSQIMSQFEVLNEDFRRKWNSPGHNTHPDGADIKIEFCPAVVDTQGNLLAEPGIHRVSRTDLGIGPSPYGVSFSKSGILPQTIWNPDNYMNIWTIELDNDFLGFAQLPNSSGLSGVPTFNGGASTDGVIITPTAFGRIGNVLPPYNQGRTTTHEVGHWLGLLHTWGDGNCSVDDFCDDTPTTGGANYGCPTGVQSCGSTDMIENYMEYTDDVCMNVYTNCQKTRMRTVIQNAPRRASLLNSMVCQNVLAPPVANFTADQTTVCEGGTIQFSDLSQNNASSWSWSFPGGSPSTSSAQNPAVTYPNPGTYNVQLIVTNGNGSDTMLQTSWVEILAGGGVAFFEETFEGEFDDWSLSNPDLQKTWQTATVGGNSPGNQAAFVNLYFYPDVGQRDGLISPIIDLTNQQSTVLEFEYAYRQFAASGQDSLIVYASTNGGATYPTRLFAKAENGSGNFATGPIFSQDFFPASASDWCTNSGASWANCTLIDLSAFDGQPNFRLKFETYNDYGNNIFIDNIRLKGDCPDSNPTDLVTDLGAGLVVYPNPATDMIHLRWEEALSESVTVSVWDMVGRVRTIPVHLGAGKAALDLPLSLSTGIYWVRINASEGSYAKMIQVR